MQHCLSLFQSSTSTICRPFLLLPNKQQACCWLLSFDTSELWLLYIKTVNWNWKLFFYAAIASHRKLSTSKPLEANYRKSNSHFYHVRSQLVIYMSSHHDTDIFQDFVSGWVDVCILGRNGRRGNSHRQCLVIIKSNFGMILGPQTHFTSLLLCCVGSSNFIHRRFKIFANKTKAICATG